MIEDVLDASDEIIRLVRSLPNRKLGAAALAVALGRVCASPEVSLEGALDLARIAAEDDTPASGTQLVTRLASLGDAA